MERRGGCCIVRYGGEPAVAWKMDRIMLRFRPIAPKPSMGGAGGPAAAAASDGCTATGKGGRKRRGSAARDGGRGRKVVKKEADNSNTTSKSNSNSSLSSASSIVTLALMPETPERKEEKEEEVKSAQAVTYIPAAWKAGMASGVVVAPMPVRPAGSWVTVECVTDTWREGEVVGSWWGCEEEAMRAAATDTCPVFLSGELDRVTWTNEAYRRMVVGEGEDDEEEEEVRVSLVTRGMIPPASPAFTCRVRVRYACRKGKGSLAAPCDVWRLADGALAWRLDVNAALSLSLGR